MSINWSQVAKQLSAMKVKEVPAFAKSVFTRENVQGEVSKFLDEYNRKYIVPGKIAPLNHLMIGVGVLSYAVGWPAEIRHLRHAEAAKKAGGDHH